MIQKKIIRLKFIKKLVLKRAKIIGDKLLPFINDDDTVLDFGCAEMSISRYILSQKKISLIGVDVVEYKINDVNFVKYSGGRLPFKNNQFDVVLAIFVLHHTDDPEFYLKELIRVSKRRIVVCEDTYINKIEEIATKLRCLISNIIVGNTDMRRSFKSVKEWKELFVRSNIKLVTFKRFCPHLLPSILARNVVMELRK